MKAILFVILNVSVCFPRGSVGVEILIPGGGWGVGRTKKNFQARYRSPWHPLQNTFNFYPALNNTVTLKSGLESLKIIETGAFRTLGCGFLFAFYIVTNNYGRIMYPFVRYLAPKSEWCDLENRVRVRSTSRSLEMAPLKIAYEFQFGFHSNYGDILCRLRDIATLVEKREIFIPHLYLAPPQGVTPSEFREDVWCW